MINKKVLIMLCNVILFNICLMGQNDTLRLSMKDAEQYAIEHNYSMKNASIDIKKAEATKWYAISTMLPQVTGTLDYTNHLGFEMEIMNMKVPMNPTSNLTIQASVAISGAQIVSATLGKMAKEMAQTNYQKTEQTTKTQIKSVYFSILAMENTLTLLGKSMENMLRLETYAQQAVTVGISEQIDADQISVQVSSLQNNINSTRRSVEMLYNSLRLLLGTSVNTEIHLTESIENILNVENANELLNENFSLANNLDYQLTEQNVALAKRQVRVNEWAYGPTLSAYYQYKSKIQTTEFDMNPPQVIGITLNIPIFSSGSKLAKVNEAKCSYQSAVNNMEMVSEQLKVQDRQLRYNLRSHFENYDTQRKNIDVSQRVFNNITNKYEQGYASSMDVTNSSINLITAQSNYIQAMLELVNAQIELEKLLNK
ncbi:MAG: TolC family protein [Bacteroidales bacterium]|nr:TolC family protein [Bacteroidales bacterium]